MTLGVNILKCYVRKYTVEIETYFMFCFSFKKRRPNYEIISQSQGIFFSLLAPYGGALPIYNRENNV